MMNKIAKTVTIDYRPKLNMTLFIIESVSLLRNCKSTNLSGHRQVLPRYPIRYNTLSEYSLLFSYYLISVAILFPHIQIVTDDHDLRVDSWTLFWGEGGGGSSATVI